MSFASPEKSAYTGRKPYDEQTLIPVTIRMLLNAKSLTNAGGTGQLALPDGREIHTIKFVGAVRNAEEQSTHIKYDIEDGTGLIEVKQFVDESTDSNFNREEREKTTNDNIYVRIIGQLKDFGDTHSVVGFSVRTLSTGNELTHHMLEVVYSAERYKKESSSSGNSTGLLPTPFGTNAPLSSPIPSTSNSLNMARERSSYGQLQESHQGADEVMHNAVLNFIRNNGKMDTQWYCHPFDYGYCSDFEHLYSLLFHLFLADEEEVGADLYACKRSLANLYNSDQIDQSIEHLSAQGFIYSTIDETKFKYAE